jgi:hypothetical protein
VNRRAAAVFAVLFAAYAATIGLDAFGGSDYAGDEPHYLLAAHSLVADGDLDVADEYRARAYRELYPYPLDRHGVPQPDGRLHEPHGAGFPALIAPAYDIGGAHGVEVLMAALTALAGALAYLLAVRVVPDPWAMGAALAVGLSPPLLAYGTAVYPETAAAAALAGAALIAARMSDRRPRATQALGCFALLALLPWLGLKFALPGLAIAAFAIRDLGRVERGGVAFWGVEVVALSVVAYVGLNEAIYGGPTPYDAETPGETATDAAFPLGYLERAYRLVALMIDREYGLLRWAPVFLLALAGTWLLVRARAAGLARALPAHRPAEHTAALCAVALLATIAGAAFLAPTMFGFWFPPRHLVAGLPLAVPLGAWGLRRLPRIGTALAAITLVASIWLYLDVRLGSGGLAAGRPDAPWGPLEAAFPYFGADPFPYVLAAAIGAALAALAAREALHWRRTAGTTRARYSG